MNNILIHIGYHKTGTTWLQNELFSANSGSFIPISNSSIGPSTLANDFIYDQHGYLLNSFDMNEEIILKNLNSIVGKGDFNDKKVPVISHERLSGNPHASGFDASIIAKRIHHCFPSAKILVIIREQCSWILSNYFQYLSIGGNHNLKKYLNTTYDGKSPGFSPNHLQFHHLIKDYQTRFSKENVLVVPYEIFRSDNSLLLQQLELFLRIQVLNPQESDSKKYYNVSKNLYSNTKLRSLNPYINPSSVKNYYGGSNKISRFLSKSAKTVFAKLIPTKYDRTIQESSLKEINEWSKDRFGESNSITSELININLGELGYKINAANL